MLRPLTCLQENTIDCMQSLALIQRVREILVIIIICFISKERKVHLGLKLRSY
jgi:hypothetical protein